jgi:hypothetical protein
MRIRVVGRKSGDTAEAIGAAVSVAIGAIKAGRYKGVIKGKCLWVYNQYTDTAIIKLMLSDTPSLVVKLDIDEYKYTDIEAVLSAAAKLYKDDTVSQFTSSAMYKNIKAISDARYLEYIDKDAIANIFMATCEAASAEATIPQLAKFSYSYSYNGTAEYECDTMALWNTNMDIPGLRTSLTRFAWFVNSAINDADVHIIQEVYDNMTSALNGVASSDWADTIEAEVNRALAAISNVNNSVRNYFNKLQMKYDMVPTDGVSAAVTELHDAIKALLDLKVNTSIDMSMTTAVGVPSPDIDIGVSEDDLSRMYGVIAIATVAEACAPHINKAIEIYNNIYDEISSDTDSNMCTTKPWLLVPKGAVDFDAAFLQECPTAAVEVVTSISTVYVDGAVSVRVHAVPMAKYIMLYAGNIHRSYTFIGADSPTSNTYNSAGQSSVEVGCSVPCAVLVCLTSARISEELQVRGSTQVTAQYADTTTSAGDPTTGASYTGSYTYSDEVTGSGTCSTVIHIQCNSIYAHGAGFPATVDIEWSTKEKDSDNHSDSGFQRALVYNEYNYDRDSTGTMELSVTPAYSVYPPLVGTTHITSAACVTTTGAISQTADFVLLYADSTADTTTARTVDVAVDTEVDGVHTWSDKLKSTSELGNAGYYVYNVRTRDDTVSATIDKPSIAEYLSHNVYETLDAADNKGGGYGGMYRFNIAYSDCCSPIMGTSMPRYPAMSNTKGCTQVFNIDYGVRYGVDIDAHSITHKESKTVRDYDSRPNTGVYTEGIDVSINYTTMFKTAPMFTDGECGPVTETLSGRVVIVDCAGDKIYAAYIIDVICGAVYNGYIMRAVDYMSLFIPGTVSVTDHTVTPITPLPEIPLLSLPLEFVRVTSTSADTSSGTYTKTVNTSTYTVDNAPEPIRNYNKLLRCPEFLVLNSLMGEEYTDTSVTPPVTKRVPSFVPLDTAIQYMSMDGEGTPTPKLNVGQIQPMFVADQSMIDQVKDRVNADIASKLQELSNEYLQDNPTAVVDEAVRKQLTPAAVKSAIEEQLFTPIRGILPAHTEVTTAAVKPVGASTSSNAKPAGIEYVLSVVSRGIGTYVDLGVLA